MQFSTNIVGREEKGKSPHLVIKLSHKTILLLNFQSSKYLKISCSCFWGQEKPCKKLDRRKWIISIGYNLQTCAFRQILVGDRLSLDRNQVTLTLFIKSVGFQAQLENAGLVTQSLLVQFLHTKIGGSSCSTLGVFVP